MEIKSIKYIKGYSLVEMIIYVSLLSVISLLATNTILSFTQSYKTLIAMRVVEHSGIDAMEKITRDIRSASSIDRANSSFGVNPGVLSLNIDENGVTVVKKVYVDNGIIKNDVDGTYFGPLTASNTVVTSLVFRNISSGISEGVRIDMTISATVGKVSKTRNYHSTIMLKGL